MQHFSDRKTLVKTERIATAKKAKNVIILFKNKWAFPRSQSSTGQEMLK